VFSLTPRPFYTWEKNPTLSNRDGVAELVCMVWRREKLLASSVTQISVLQICCQYERQIK
jgi:hypothetical protein